jgi:hypothetical protein
MQIVVDLDGDAHTIPLRIGILCGCLLAFASVFDEHLTECRRKKETVGTPEDPDHCLGFTTMKLAWQGSPPIFWFGG